MLQKCNVCCNDVAPLQHLMRASLGARFLAVVMRLAKRLNVVRVKPQPVIAVVRHDVIADVAERLSNATFSAR